MDEKKVILQRVWMDKNQSTGSLIVLDKFRQPIYISPWENSPKFGMVWELKDVPNRSECKIHVANTWDQINGCIAPGTYLGELNGDGYYDTIASGEALKRFHLALEDMQEQGTTITIFNSYL